MRWVVTTNRLPVRSPCGSFEPVHAGGVFALEAVVWVCVRCGHHFELAVLLAVAR